MTTHQNTRAEAQHALKQAARASKQGDLKEAERWSKTAERLAAAADRLAAAPPPPDEEEDVEALRAELRRRVQRFVEAAQEQQEWEAGRAAYEAAVRDALANGTPPPPPLPPNPYDDAALDRIARGDYGDVKA